MTDATESRPASLYDNCLRYTVPSARSKGVTYLVQLDSYGGNGRCVCTDFQTRFEPLLSRGIDAESAIKGGEVKLRSYHRKPSDALRCKHIIEARDQFADHMIRAMVRANQR